MYKNDLISHKKFNLGSGTKENIDFELGLHTSPRPLSSIRNLDEGFYLFDLQ